MKANKILLRLDSSHGVENFLNKQVVFEDVEVMDNSVISAIKELDEACLSHNSKMDTEEIDDFIYVHIEVNDKSSSPLVQQLNSLIKY